MQTSKKSLIKRLAWVTAGGLLLGGPILWPSFASGYAEGMRKIAQASSRQVENRVEVKSEVQRHLDALYARDGKPTPRMQQPTLLESTAVEEAITEQTIRSTRLEMRGSGFVTPVANTEGEETSVFGKILAKFRRNPPAPTTPPEEPNPYQPGTYSGNSTPVGQAAQQGQDRPVQPAAMPQLKQMLANPIPQNDQQGQTRQGGQTVQQQAPQGESSRRRQRHPAVQHGAISDQPSQQPVFVIDESTADRQGRRAVGPADGDLNTGWNSSPTPTAATPRAARQPLGQQPANPVPWDGLTEPGQVVATAESADFFPDDNTPSNEFAPRLGTANVPGPPNVEAPLTDELGGLSAIGAGPGNAGGPRRPAAKPEVEVDSTTIDSTAVDTAPEPTSSVPNTASQGGDSSIEDEAAPAETNGSGNETFVDPFTGLTLESRPATAPSPRSQTLPTPGASVPVPPSLHDTGHPLSPGSIAPRVDDAEPAPVRPTAPEFPSIDSTDDATNSASIGTTDDAPGISTLTTEAPPNTSLVPQQNLNGDTTTPDISERPFPMLEPKASPELQSIESLDPIGLPSGLPDTAAGQVATPEVDEEPSGTERMPLLVPETGAPSELKTPEN